MADLGLTATWGRTEYASFVLQALREQSALLRAGARFIPINGRSAVIPRQLADPVSTWVAELEEIPSDAPTGDTITLLPKKNANVVVLSNESIGDAPVSELDAVGASLTRAVANALDAKAFSADAATATAPAGLLSYTLGSQDGGVASVDSFISAQGQVAEIGGNANAVFLNPRPSPAS